MPWFDHYDGLQGAIACLSALLVRLPQPAAAEVEAADMGTAFGLDTTFAPSIATPPEPRR
ncbi:MAG: hypothetical protein H0W48_03530 [Methylibium sp.]|uniref:hypothetical protein n=1 Tax=Methylibium sp. TaxID=2067992 RepID=UPI0017A09F15|nr:hypothetical protein [Methylibium sp.]MBA2724307.1 hypothetical protein [Methylibium sp.]MBA3591181.1 hypothetical protein [Methylibium sp.]MBA3623526.1 hypothetical protein [Methylibium sp.]